MFSIIMLVIIIIFYHKSKIIIPDQKEISEKEVLESINAIKSNPTHIFFNGGGFYASCYIESLIYLYENGINLDFIIGSSGGCLTALAAALYSKSEIPKLKIIHTTIQNIIDKLYKTYSKCQMFKNIKHIIRMYCNTILSDVNDYKKCNGKLNIVVSRFNNFKFIPVIINNFTSNDHLIDTIQASMHIPFICAFKKAHISNQKKLYDGDCASFKPPPHIMYISFYYTGEYKRHKLLSRPSKKEYSLYKKAIINLTKRELIRISATLS
jgi:predicted acylesterase/phospholipase RssA